ncbi:hypothetical protein BDN70DRAFT_939930 [Pholiota conissans]|uniref:Uncharacterized protein n=1 Tax=Pholiota conissans TaxID=109636 RepID=A0A9P5YHW3_9AGAR|nr:hypothetical protein BDN70DRAFT_939930 [Pholiota conissans]
MVLVNYPQRMALDGEAIMPLAAGPRNEGVISITPEMRFPEKYTNTGFAKPKAITYVQEGATISSMEQHIDFIGREITLLTNFILSQLPEKYGVQFHADKALEAISYRTSDNKRKTLAPWIDAPGFRPKDASRDLHQTGKFIEDLIDQAPIRARIIAELEAHQKNVQRFIPQSVASKKVEPLTDEEMGGVKWEADKTQTHCMDHKLAYKNRRLLDSHADRRMRLEDHVPGADNPIEEITDKSDERVEEMQDACSSNNSVESDDNMLEHHTQSPDVCLPVVIVEDNVCQAIQTSDESDDEGNDRHTSANTNVRKRARTASKLNEHSPRSKRTRTTGT